MDGLHDDVYHQQPSENVKSMEKGQLTNNMNTVDNQQSDNEQAPKPDVEIIDYSQHFEPYQSHLAREFSDEDRMFNKRSKRARALLNWKWEEVIDVDSYENGQVNNEEEVVDVHSYENGQMYDEAVDEELIDTAASATPLRISFKVPRVLTNTRNRVRRLRDDNDEDDYITLTNVAQVSESEFTSVPAADEGGVTEMS